MGQEKLRFGIVGAVGRGSSFVASLQAHAGGELVAMCDVQAELLAQRAAEVGVSQTFADAEAMFDSGAIDAVILGTPMPLHVPHAVLALDRGIHVLSEVPAGVSVEQCRDLAAAARRSSARYMLAENYCYNRNVVLVKQMARAGVFGEMYYAEGAYLHELKELNEVTKWRRRWQTGINGNTYCTHSLGPPLQWLAPQRVTAVCCAGSGHHYRDPRGDQYQQEDSVVTLCRLTGGGLVSLRLDMLSNRPHNMGYVALQGTDGCVETARGLGDVPKVWLRGRTEDGQWQPLEDYAEEFLPPHWLNAPAEAQTAGHEGGDYWELDDFIGAIREGRELEIGIHEALDMTLPGLASQESIAQGGTWVAVGDSRTW